MVTETNIHKGESKNMHYTWAAIYLEFVERCDTKYMFSHRHKNQDYWLQEFSEDVFSYTEFLLILSVPMWVHQLHDMKGPRPHGNNQTYGQLYRWKAWKSVSVKQTHCNKPEYSKLQKMYNTHVLENR